MENEYQILIFARLRENYAIWEQAPPSLEQGVTMC